MDATKAFDRVTYSKLFRLLIDRDLPACIIRLLLNAYASNFCACGMGNVSCEYFLATNSVYVHRKFVSTTSEVRCWLLCW